MSLNMTNNRAINVLGLHASFGLNGLHCETTRAESWTACSTMYGSRLATDADQRASFDNGHECCLCAYIDIGIRYFLQGTPGYCRNKPRGWVVCTQCASLFCVHDIGKKGDNTLPSEWCDNNCNDTISKHISLTYEPPRHFAGDNFRCIFVNENVCILIKISLKFVTKKPIDNSPALV